MIVGLNVFAHIFFGLERRKQLRRRNSEDFKFSGEAMERGSLWVTVSATLLHASHGHLANNMIMLIGFMNELETVTGPWLFGIMFFAIGIAGWLTTFLLARFILYQTDAWMTAKWQTSVGASPAVYGLCFSAVILLGDRHIGSAFGVLGQYSFIPFLSLFFVPEVLDPFRWESISLLSRMSLLIAGCFVVWLLSPLFGSITALTWLSGYFIKTIICSMYDKYSGRISSEDESAHLGGSLAGICFGLCVHTANMNLSETVLLAINFGYIVLRAYRRDLFTA